jgi:DNA-binding helix-hairpin-helix protein with protein kinase domain
MWPRSVAKIYARRPDDQTQMKLAAMVQLGTEELASFAAWPQRLLLDPKTRTVLGFLMPRVDGHREIHTLYGPADRKAAFPDASWSFLVRAARNLAAAFDAVHRHGHVIGDVNQGNVVVSRKATVRLIDCLFMGRHPFAGRHPDRVLSVEAAIREGLFAFGCEARRRGWEPPPFSLPLEEVTPPVAALFERAFGREAAAGGPRPTAAEWVHALDELEEQLVLCGDDPRHARVRGNGSCPWCRIENAGGPSFFFLAQGTAPDAFDLDETWKSIEAVPSPGEAPLPAPPAPEEPPKPRPKTATQRLKLAIRGLLTPGAASRHEADSERREQEIENTRKRVRRLEDQWKTLCGEADFLARKRQLAEARESLEGLKAVEEGEWADLEAGFRDKRLPDHLRTFALEFARIPGLGPAELGRLADRGITTAADVDPARLMAIRYIDLDLVRALLLFKLAATRAFAFDPVTGIPGKDRKALEETQGRRRAALLAALQSGPLFLAEARRQALVWRACLKPDLDNASQGSPLFGAPLVALPGRSVGVSVTGALRRPGIRAGCGGCSRLRGIRAGCGPGTRGRSSPGAGRLLAARSSPG